MGLLNFNTWDAIFWGKVYVRVAVNIKYVNYKAKIDGKVAYKVYNTMERNSFGEPIGRYRYYFTPSEAARRANVVLKKNGYTGKPLTYLDIKGCVQNALGNAQYYADKLYREQRLKAFTTDFVNLMKKHDMHIQIQDCCESEYEIYLLDKKVGGEVSFGDFLYGLEITESN